MDVSFISVRRILPALVSVLAPGAEAVVLVKPQFEVGRFQVGRGGIVKDPALHLSALADVAVEAQERGWGVRGACPSPVTGAEGNREFFLHLVRGAPPKAKSALQVLVERATAPVRRGTGAEPKERV
jgi:23S rRNA (cytidine1920-2'-O)/16S rRNA (cytidine1409-2'-O)-methyltransferase